MRLKPYIIFKTRPLFIPFFSLLFILYIFLLIYNWIGSGSLERSFEVVFNKPLAPIVALLFIIMILIFYMAEFIVTEQQLKVRYLLRPFFRNYEFNFNDIDRISIHHYGAGSVSPRFIVYLRHNSELKKTILPYHANRKDMRKLKEYLIKEGIKVELLEYR